MIKGAFFKYGFWFRVLGYGMRVAKINDLEKKMIAFESRFIYFKYDPTYVFCNLSIRILRKGT